MRTSIAVSLAMCALAWSGRARAGDKASAEAAFQEGKDLLKAGRTEAACTAFEKSQTLDPQLGTEYNLATCYEKAGRLASAWAAFRELAQRDTNAARKTDSERHAAALQPRLIKLSIGVRAPAAGLHVTRNGDDVTASVGIESPIDPGEYEIGAIAQGYKPWSVKVSARQEGGTVQVTVPELERLPEAPASGESGGLQPLPTGPGAHDAAVADGGGRRRLGLYIGGGGLAVVAGGLALGYVAQKSWSEARRLCGDPAACTAMGDDLATAQRDRKNATTFGDASTIAIAVGGAALAAGAIVYLTAPHDHRAEHASLRIAPAITTDGVAVFAQGSF